MRPLKQQPVDVSRSASRQSSSSSVASTTQKLENLRNLVRQRVIVHESKFFADQADAQRSLQLLEKLRGDTSRQQESSLTKSSKPEPRGAGPKSTLRPGTQANHQSQRTIQSFLRPQVMSSSSTSNLLEPSPENPHSQSSLHLDPVAAVEEPTTWRQPLTRDDVLQLIDQIDEENAALKLFIEQSKLMCPTETASNCGSQPSECNKSEECCDCVNWRRELSQLTTNAMSSTIEAVTSRMATSSADVRAHEVAGVISEKLMSTVAKSTAVVEECAQLEAALKSVQASVTQAEQRCTGMIPWRVGGDALCDAAVHNVTLGADGNQWRPVNWDEVLITWTTLAEHCERQQTDTRRKVVPMLRELMESRSQQWARLLKV